MIEQAFLDEIRDFASSREISEIHADDASLVLELIQGTSKNLLGLRAPGKIGPVANQCVESQT